MVQHRPAGNVTREVLKMDNNKPKKVKKDHSKAKKIACGIITGAPCTTMVVGNIVCAQPNMKHTISAYFGGMNVTDESKKKASYENAADTSLKIAEEGLVLLKNQNNALPLASGTNVNLFGYAAAHTYVSGSGSSGTGNDNAVTLKDALESAGFNVNEDLYNKYSDYKEDDSKNAFLVPEPSQDNTDFYSDDLWKSYEDFSDTAVMVMGRKGGEGADLQHGYLSIDDDERALLDQLEQRFDKVIVLVNTGNAMELGFLEEEGVDAAMLINYTGNNGATAVAEALAGTINPSGKTIDTYAYDHKSNPSYYHSGIEGTREYTDMDKDSISGKGHYYVDYKEGIYVGYKYYETRYVDNETGEVDEDAYKDAVQYPFGYGLSYTSFDEEITGHSGDLSGDNGKVTVKVKVTNTGNTAGKQVVELYATPPYTVGGIEKSAVNLVAYGKTDELQPGESQELELSFTAYDLASYDYNDANSDGHKGYELENGDYVISLRSDAHTTVDSFDLSLDKTKNFDTDPSTGYKVENRFDDIAGNDESENIVYLSRADWEGTSDTGDGRDDSYLDYDAAEGMTSYSIVYTPGRAASKAVLNSTNDYVSEHYADNDDTDAEMPTTGAKNGLKISDMKGLSYDDEKWDKLLDELSVSDMQYLIGSGSMGIGYLDSIGLAQTAANDGTQGITPAYAYNGGTSTDACYSYPNEGAVASSWNTQMAYDEGEAVAQEADACNVTTWYAPGANIHRTPYGGRNCDYYSEDPLISGTMAASIIQGGKDNGLVVMMKHFAVNEQETARNVDGLYTWLTEQSLREEYLKPFEIAVKNSDCRAIMSSFNRIGATWTGNSYNLLTEVLRNEWGYVGMVNSDAYVPGTDATYYMQMDSGIRAGNDIWLQGFGSDKPSTDKNEAYTVQVMRENCHRILYSIADSSHNAASNSLQTWQIALYALTAAVFAGSAYAIWRTFFRKKNKKDKK